MTALYVSSTASLAVAIWCFICAHKIYEPDAGVWQILEALGFSVVSAASFVGAIQAISELLKQ